MKYSLLLPVLACISCPTAVLAQGDFEAGAAVLQALRHARAGGYSSETNRQLVATAIGYESAMLQLFVMDSPDLSGSPRSEALASLQSVLKKCDIAAEIALNEVGAARELRAWNAASICYIPDIQNAFKIVRGPDGGHIDASRYDQVRAYLDEMRISLL